MLHLGQDGGKTGTVLPHDLPCATRLRQPHGELLHRLQTERIRRHQPEPQPGPGPGRGPLGSVDSAAAGLGVQAPDRSRYSPVSLELDPMAVNNGSGIPRCPPVDTKDPALQITPGQPSVTPVPPPLPRSSWLHNQKEFQSPYIKTSMQGDVYNFLERPAGLKCFLYHFLV
ncbi:hypothetical protein WMY93_023380 [Mugilogobius chulae]|uniref:Uncharacterized protein n=1 Tax=Mugilogobius chulae TaxID=88201 RepID=A0AAW0N8K5_9GOBI